MGLVEMNAVSKGLLLMMPISIFFCTCTIVRVISLTFELMEYVFLDTNDSSLNIYNNTLGLIFQIWIHKVF